MKSTVIRRWRIRKHNIDGIGDRWVVYAKPTTRRDNWKFVNYYETFEDARSQVVDAVDIYYRIKKS